MTISGNQVALGIDLGTTRLTVASLDTIGRPRTLLNSEGEAATPSTVFFDRSSIFVGNEARKAAEYEPDRAVQFSKRDVGQKAFQIAVAGQHLPHEVIQALILKALKDEAVDRVGPLDQCVLTVPACFNETQRKATQDAGRLAGLNAVHIINEPTAAALAWGVQRGIIAADGSTESVETVLVYSLGGGTFDATLMEINGNDYTVIASAGDMYLGGIDWDQRVADYVADQVVLQSGTDPRKDRTQRRRLMTAAEDAKCSLSQRDEVVIRFDTDGDRIRIPMNRMHLERLCADLIERTRILTREALKAGNRTWKDVSQLLLAGGSSRMPIIKEMLESESNLQVDRWMPATELVAHGAAVYAGILLSTDRKLSSGLCVYDVNSHDLGLLGPDKDSRDQRRSMIIRQNTRLPARKGKRFSTSRKNQTRLSVKVVEGGDDTGQHSTLVGDCVVRDLPPNLPAGTPVDIFFHYNNDGRLHVTTALPTTGTSASIDIEHDSGLTPDDLQYWSDRIKIGLQEFSSISEPSATPTLAPLPRMPAQSARAVPNETHLDGGWKSRRQRVKPGETA